MPEVEPPRLSDSALALASVLEKSVGVTSDKELYLSAVRKGKVTGPDHSGDIFVPNKLLVASRSPYSGNWMRVVDPLMMLSTGVIYHINQDIAGDPATLIERVKQQQELEEEDSEILFGRISDKLLDELLDDAGKLRRNSIDQSS